MNNTSLLTLVVTALVAFGLGYHAQSIVKHSGDQMNTQHAGGSDKHDMEHVHDELLEVTAANAPAVSLAVHKDAQSGYNAQLTTTNFTFSPENASQDHVAGEGHAHLYINGEKVGRLYSDWHHIGALPEGTHTVRVTLNTNDHRGYAHDGVAIEDTAEIHVGGMSEMQAEHDHH